MARRRRVPGREGRSRRSSSPRHYELDDDAYEDIARTGGTETWWYTRLGNPTVDAVAAKLAALEGAEAGLAFASGMAAITSTVMSVLEPGQRIVAARELYGETFTLFD